MGSRCGKRQSRLQRSGYATMKLEDSCVKNSNMIQSMDPNVTHGSQLKEMFCYNFRRPNCLGEDLAANHVLEYTKRFITAQQPTSLRNGSSTVAKPWAAFLSFTDSHEDSMALAGVLDEPLSVFLTHLSSAGHMKNTVIMLLSDHGMHYGPYYNTYDGQREHRHPPLYTWVPDRPRREVMLANADKRTSPFDVYATLEDVASLPNQESSHANGNTAEPFGKSLVKAVMSSSRTCHSAGIPNHFCGLPESPSYRTLQDPPSQESFYADMLSDSKANVGAKCKASTDSLNPNAGSLPPPGHCHCWRAPDPPQKWQRCSLPMAKFNSGVAAAVCKGRLQLYFQPTEKHSAQQACRESGDASRCDPSQTSERSVLVLEVDSVSHARAQRSLKKTTQLLRGARVSPTMAKTLQQWHRLEYQSVNSVGSNSIPNQLALLKGCSEVHDQRYNKSFDLKQHRGLKEVMYDASFGRHMLCEPDLPPHKGDTRKNPGNSSNYLSWLFDITKDKGGVTLFVEEFCSTSSAWYVLRLWQNVVATHARGKVGHGRSFRGGLSR